MLSCCIMQRHRFNVLKLHLRLTRVYNPTKYQNETASTLAMYLLWIVSFTVTCSILSSVHDIHKLYLRYVTVDYPFKVPEHVSLGNFWFPYNQSILIMQGKRNVMYYLMQFFSLIFRTDEKKFVYEQDIIQWEIKLAMSA